MRSAILTPQSLSSALTSSHAPSPTGPSERRPAVPRPGSASVPGARPGLQAPQVGAPAARALDPLPPPRPPVTAPQAASCQGQARAIERCFDQVSPWSALRDLTTRKDIEDVRSMCLEINPKQWADIFVEFFAQVLEARRVQPPAIAARNAALPKDWFNEPFYCLYVQYFGTRDGELTANFADLTDMLDYLEALEVRNLYLFPHYESPMGDGGYDPSGYVPRESLGGPAGFAAFMAEATRRGFRVATDAPFNHTSVEHPWFKQALAGDPEKLDYYLRVDGRRKVGESDNHGDLIAHYVDPDGTRTSLTLIFPDVSRTHDLTAEVNGQRHQFFREFYPFQVDLDLRNPAVLKELFSVLADEANLGVLGKRTDAIPHWLKRRGTANDGLPETHALQALFKSFLRHLSPAIIIPEVVRSAGLAAQYAGMETAIRGERAPSEGDAIFAFEMQGALRETLYFQTSAPFWETVFKLPPLPGGASWLIPLEHHDETYLGFIREHNRHWLGKYIEDHGGRVYKNGMSAGGRYADCLDNDPQRIALAHFLQYMTPGVPALYYGTEIGARNQPEHATRAQAWQHEVLTTLGVRVPYEKVFDPRELQRGPIPRRAFLEAAETGTQPFATARRLNSLRATRPVLRDILLTPLASGDDGVLALVRLPAGGEDRPVIAVANLTNRPKVATFSSAELAEKFGADAGTGLEDLIRRRPITLRAAGDHLELPLEPYEFALLDRGARRRVRE